MLDAVNVLLPLSWLLSAMLATNRAAAPQSLVVYDPSLGMHRDFVHALTEENRGVLRLELDRNWPDEPPRIAVAVGDRALRRVEKTWPDTPVAAVLLWYPPTQKPAADRLVVSVHPAARCTADALEDVPGDGRWVVLSGPDDTHAKTLADKIDGRLLSGTATSVHTRLRSLPPHGRNKIWIRAAPELAQPEWLRFLAMVARHPQTYVGIDVPGLARIGGIQHPLVPDYESVARSVVEWSRRARKRRRARQTVVELPCASH